MPSNRFTACAAFKYHRSKKMNTTNNTEVGISVHGSAMAFNIKILARERYICMVSKKLLGKSSSIAPMSLENLFNTRPGEKESY